jgi:hypothetical protein
MVWQADIIAAPLHQTVGDDGPVAQCETNQSRDF